MANERQVKKMGLTIPGMTPEQMCDAMCNNIVPEFPPTWWIFTFGTGQPHAGHYVRIYGTFDSAREKMFRKYGSAWGFQYSEEEWNNWMAEKPDYVPAEELLEEIGGDGNDST